MLYILTGGDEFSVHRALDDIKKGLGSSAEVDMNMVTLDGRQVTIDDLRGACETVPFLASKRLVVIEGLLGRFAKGRDRKAAKSGGDSHKAYGPLAAYLKSIPDFTVVVLIEDIAGNNPLFNELAGSAQVRTFAPLGGDQLGQWVRQRLAAAGGKISRPALEALVRRVGGDLYTMAGEVDKLMAFARARTIEESDVRALVSDIQESSVFALVDAILDHRAGVAENILEEFLERGAAPAYLITMILRQAGLIVRARDLKERRVPRPQMQTRLGLRDFALSKTLQQAGRYQTARLKQVYARLLETDLAIKTGRLNGDFALNILIAELAAE